MNSTKVERKDLRIFSLLFSILLSGIFGLLIPFIYDLQPNIYIFYTSGIIVAVGLILPILILPLYWLWMKIGHVLGIINTTIILFLIFALMIVPFGLFLRLTKSLQLQKNIDKNTDSYLIINSETFDPKSLEKPY